MGRTRNVQPRRREPLCLGTPSQEQIDNDHRSLAQRQHDALVAVGRSVLESGELGQHNGLPTSIIVRTTLQDLESRAGVGVTGGGTVIPISDVIRMAAHANHYLAVFDKATGSALDLFRARRVASPAQRIMLIARDGGRPRGRLNVYLRSCPTAPSYSDLEVGDLGERIAHAGHVVVFIRLVVRIPGHMEKLTGLRHAQRRIVRVQRRLWLAEY